MTYEKSCGALVIHYDNNNTPHVLMIKHVSGGHRSFPKGHVEAGETEHMTAEREVMEETSVRIHIHEKFRHSVFYSPKPGVRKEVVYFLAYSKYTNAKPHIGEIAEVEWIPLYSAEAALTHENDKIVLRDAISYLEEKRARKAALYAQKNQQKMDGSLA